MSLLKYEGAEFFRQRIVMATLAGRAVRIDKIRPDDDHVGLKDFEIAFLRLIEKLTNGCGIEINHTGTAVTYRPGAIIGGSVTHACGTERSLSYFIEGIIAIAPFSKKPFSVNLQGITNDTIDVSVDTIRTVTLPQLKRFGIEGAELKINRRGVYPLGGGEVWFTCPIIKALKPVNFIDEGRILKIRGTVFVSKLSPLVANRCVESARSLLNKFIPDVYLYTDVCKGKESGLSAGFGVSLTAESTSGVLLSIDYCAKPGETPEEVGLKAAKMLYQQIYMGGCADIHHQWMYILMVTLGPEDVSIIRFGKLSEFTIQYLRDVYKVFGVKFNITAEDEFRTKLVGVGSGFMNLNKAVQ